MSTFTVKKPQGGDPIRARDHRRILAQVRENALQFRGGQYGALTGAQRVALMEVNALPNPGEITAKVSGGADVFVTVTCDITFSELARDSVTYVYTDFNTRTASKSGETDETHKLTPSLNVGDTFLAVSAQGKWYAVDLGGRQWAAV